MYVCVGQVADVQVLCVFVCVYVCACVCGSGG